MKVTYSFFCDESGSFGGIDRNVICPIIFKGNVIPTDQIIELWKYIFPEGNWQNFHACTMTCNQTGDVFKRIFDKLLSKDNVTAAYGYHQSHKNYHFDFYPAVLFKFLSWYFGELIRGEITQFNFSSEDSLALFFKIYLAERLPLNTILLAKNIQEENRVHVRNFTKGLQVSLNKIHYQTDVYLVPIKRDPCIQISDALSNVIRAYYNSANFDKETTALIQSLDNIKLYEKQLNTNPIKAMCAQLRSAVPQIPDTGNQNDTEKNRKKKSKPQIKAKTKIVTKSVYVPYSDPVPTLLGTIYKRAKEFRTKGRSLFISKLADAVTSYQDLEEYKRVIIIDQLLEQTYNIIQIERDYQLGDKLVAILYRLLEMEHGAAEMPTGSINRRETRSAVLYLFLKNHCGIVVKDDPRLVQSLRSIPELQQDISCWNLICDFFNNLAVAKHNSFEFEKSIEELYPIVRQFEQDLKNPLTGKNVRAFEIGALFGTYAQSLAFSGHCRFFNEGPSVLDETLDEAAYYSELAQEHFDHPLDIERQVTYRAHFRMQRYILTGDKAALREAGELLQSDQRSEQAVDDFIDLISSNKCLIPAFRLCAVLKQAYFLKRAPEWFNKLVSAVTKNWQSLPVEHPMQQLLSYLILFCTNREQRRKLMTAFEQMDFTGQLTGTLKSIMALQIAYHEGQSISEEIFKAAEDSILDAIKPRWERYGLNRVLAEYKGRPDRWHVGPMEVLPFNYC